MILEKPHVVFQDEMELLYMMNTRDIAEEYRMAHWAGIMRERQASGQSIKEYCQSVGCHANTYYYWQRKLREAASLKISESSVMMSLTSAVENDTSEQSLASTDRSPVLWAGIDTRTHLTDSECDSKIRISREGWTVSVERGVDPEQLTKVLRAVSRACC